MANIKTLSAAKLLSAIESQETKEIAFCDQFIAAGRGHERMSDIRNSSDDLAKAYCAAMDLGNSLRSEKAHRLAYHGSLKPVKVAS